VCARSGHKHFSQEKPVQTRGDLPELKIGDRNTDQVAHVILLVALSTIALKAFALAQVRLVHVNTATPSIAVNLARRPRSGRTPRHTSHLPLVRSDRKSSGDSLHPELEVLARAWGDLPSSPWRAARPRSGGHRKGSSRGPTQYQWLGITGGHGGDVSRRRLDTAHTRRDVLAGVTE